MVELRDLLGLDDGLDRNGAPEPLLLPRIAQVIDESQAAWIAEVVAQLSVPVGNKPRWPLLADATMEAFAARTLPIEVRDECVGRLVDVGAGQVGLTDLVDRVLRDHFESDDEAKAALLDAIGGADPETQLIRAATVLPAWPEDERDDLIALIIGAAGNQPAWLDAAAASRIGPFVSAEAHHEVLTALLDNNWLSAYTRLHGQMTIQADSAFDEVTRAFPFDRELADQLASADVQDLLVEVVWGICDIYDGAPAQASIGGGSEPELPRTNGDEQVLGLDPKPPTDAGRRAHVRVFADLGNGDVDELKQDFAAESEHEVRLWIGPPSPKGIQASDAMNEPDPTPEDLEQGFVTIEVTMIHGDQRQDDQLQLPIDTTKASKSVVFTLTATAEPVTAFIWLRHNGGILQFLELEGNVSAEPHIGSPSDAPTAINLLAKAVIRSLPTSGSAPQFQSAITRLGDKMLVFGPHGSPGTTHSLQDSQKLVTEINDLLLAAMKKEFRDSPSDMGTKWVEDPSPTVTDLLIFIARWGSLLFDELGGDKIGDPIQFVNLDPKEIVPIEYVYDRPSPDNDAVVCPSWRQVLEPSGDAPTKQDITKHVCSDSAGDPLDAGKVVCPLGFWSLTRVIERHYRDRPEGQDETSIATSTAGPLPILDTAVFATAPTIKALDVSSVVAQMTASFPSQVQATTWDMWREEVAKSPPLLVLIPHHGVDKKFKDGFLEIGPQGAEPEPGIHHLRKITAKEVGDNKDSTGPVVFLLGCKTAESELLPFQNFARSFQLNHASVVVATMATVFGEHAAPVANEFIRQLLEKNNEGKLFGEVLRDVRLGMFAKGYLMALALVAFGNADWTLAKEKATPDVSD